MWRLVKMEVRFYLIAQLPQELTFSFSSLALQGGEEVR